MAKEEVAIPPQGEEEKPKNYVIQEGEGDVPVRKAYVKLEYRGKEEEFVLRALTVQELSYSIDEFLTVKSGGSVDIKVGAMIIALLPKSLIKAPFPITDNNSVLNAWGGLALEFVDPIMELNGLNLAKEKK